MSYLFYIYINWIYYPFNRRRLQQRLSRPHTPIWLGYPEDDSGSSLQMETMETAAYSSEGESKV